jgi:hypothetical protein
VSWIGVVELLRDVDRIVAQRRPQAGIVWGCERGETRSEIGSIPSSGSRSFAALIAVFGRWSTFVTVCPPGRSTSLSVPGFESR